MRLFWPSLLALIVALAAALGLAPSGQAQEPTLLLVTAQDVSFLAQAGQDTRQSLTVGLASTGAPIAWTASISPTVGWLVLGTTEGVAPSVPAEPIGLPIYLQTLGLPAGQYPAQIVVTANAGQTVANSPVIIPVTLYVAAQLRQVYLPLILQGQAR